MAFSLRRALEIVFDDASLVQPSAAVLPQERFPSTDIRGPPPGLQRVVLLASEESESATVAASAGPAELASAEKEVTIAAAAPEPPSSSPAPASVKEPPSGSPAPASVKEEAPLKRTFSLAFDDSEQRDTSDLPQHSVEAAPLAASPSSSLPNPDETVRPPSPSIAEPPAVLPDPEVVVPPSPPSLFVVCIVHLGYPDIGLADETLSYAQVAQTACASQEVPCDIYATAVHDNVYHWLRQHHPDVQARKVENRGVDILPFLTTLRQAMAAQPCYTHVLKVHSKRVDSWRHHLTVGLVDSADAFRNVLAHMRSPSVGMMGPCTGGVNPNHAHLVGMTMELGWCSNVQQARHLCASSSFSGGTYFCARTDLLMEAFQRLDLAREYALSPIGNAYGSMETRLHALERLFGVACTRSGRRYIPVGVSLCHALSLAFPPPVRPALATQLASCLLSSTSRPRQSITAGQGIRTR